MIYLERRKGKEKRKSIYLRKRERESTYFKEKKKVFTLVKKNLHYECE